MWRFFIRMIFIGLFPMSILSANAASCVDIDNASDNSGAENRWVLTNTCQHAVDVSIKRNGGNHSVCTVLHIEAGASRSFKQQKVCHGQNSLIVGCSCETSFSTVERAAN